MSKQNKAEKNLAYKEKEKMNMRKMNLREFAEVVAALVNKNGIVCFVDNHGDDGQIVLTCQNGPTTIKSELNSLWQAYNEDSVDINHIAQAVTQAFTEVMKNGSRTVANAATKKQPTMSSVMPKTAPQPKPQPQPQANTEPEPQSLADLVNALFNNNEQKQPKQQTAKTGGSFAYVLKKKEPAAPVNNGMSREYDPIEDVPEDQRELFNQALESLAKQFGIEGGMRKRMPMRKEERNEKEEVKNNILNNVLPLLIPRIPRGVAEDCSDAVGRDIFDMSVVYYIDNDFIKRTNLPADGTAVLSRKVISDLDMSEEELYEAAVKNLTKRVIIADGKDLVSGKFPVRILSLSIDNIEHGAAAILGNNILHGIAEVLKEDALIVAPVLDSMSLIFPASKVSAGDVEEANKNVLSNIDGNILTDEVYVYSKDDDCLVAPAYKL